MNTLLRKSALLFGFIMPAAAHAADLGLPVAYVCGDHAVAIVANADEARLRLGGGWRTFRPAIAASGAKYEAEGNPDQWVWGKGDEFTISLPETGEIACSPAAAPPGAFAAGGFEPGWRLTIDGDEAQLAIQDGTALKAPPGAPESVPGGRKFAFGAATVEVADRLCRDAATGMPHPHSVRLTGADVTLEGCGGAPRDLLVGLTWKIAKVSGAPVAEGVEANIRFEADGTFSGASGCNRMIGTYELTGEGLSIGPAATTMMACPDAQMQTERAVTEALTKVTRFDFAGDGGLVLVSGDSPVLEANP